LRKTDILEVQYQSAFKSIDVKESHGTQASRSNRVFDETTSFILITSSKSMLYPTKQKENPMQGNLKYDEKIKRKRDFSIVISQVFRANATAKQIIKSETQRNRIVPGTAPPHGIIRDSRKCTSTHQLY
jgi:hypothetical protein